MTCRKARILIHLNRPGELSEKNFLALQNHLSTCVSCNEEMEYVRQTPLESPHLKLDTPDSIQVHRNVDRVLAAIRTLPASKTDAVTHPYRLGSMMLSRRVRYGTAVLAATCILAFLVQGVSVIYDASQVEEQLSTANTAEHSIILQLPASPRSLGRQVDLETMRAFPEWEQILQAFEQSHEAGIARAVLSSADPRLVRAAASVLTSHAISPFPSKK